MKKLSPLAHHCDICGKPRGKSFDHRKCSGIRKARGGCPDRKPECETENTKCVKLRHALSFARLVD